MLPRIRGAPLKTYMKNLLLALVTVITLNTATAAVQGVPQFRPDLGCTYVSTVTEYFPVVGGPAEAHEFYVFLMRASSIVSDGLVEVQFWREGQTKSPLILRNPEFNNIGKNCLKNVTLDDVLGYSGYGPSQVPNEGSRVRWYVWSAQNNHANSIHWNTWLSNNTTLCDDEDDSPVSVACMDANDDVVGFYEISGWNQNFVNINNRFYIPLLVTGYASYYPVTGLPDTYTGGPTGNQYWSNSDYVWATSQKMNISIAGGQLFK